MISKVSILLSVFFILTAILFSIYLAKVKDAGKKRKPLILYLVLGGVLIGLISAQGFIEFTKQPLWIFIASQAWLLIIGILHTWLFEKIIPLENKNSGKILFTMALCFFGYGLAILVFMIYFKSPFPKFYLLPAFFFIAPTFVAIAFDNFVRIPLKVHKAWAFPAPGTLPDPTDNEMADPIIVNFEISKQPDDSRTVFKAKAPKAMDLGRLFYFFVMDYNSRHPNHPILITDSQNNTSQWLFYQSPNIVAGKKHLDPEMSIADNKIKENSFIICKRINS